MTHFQNTNTLEFELSGGWLTIWLNQVEKRNALTDELRNDLHDAFRTASTDAGVRGITLRGRGSVFCAGGDLRQFKSQFQSTASVDDILIMSRDAAAIFDDVNTAPQVVIALVEGAALAGGFGLAACADVVISTADAKFAMTEAMLGLSPAQIAPFVIQKLGYAVGRRLMLTAARFDGREALSLGFADYVAETIGDAESAESRLRSHILQCAPGAIADTKKLLRDIQGLPRPDVIEIAAANFAERMTSSEAIEGISAFFDKRPPSWAANVEAKQ